MKKVLLFLFFVSTANAQDVEKARYHLNEALKALESTGYITGLNAHRDGNYLELKWTQGTPGLVDFTYCNETECHSYAEYVDSVNTAREELRIYAPKKDTWLVQAEKGEWQSEVVEVTENELDDNFLYGYWDHTDIDFVNVGKSLDNRCRYILDQDLKCVAILSGFQRNSPDQWEERLQDKASQMNYSVDDIPLVILIDEPISKGWSESELDQLTELAQNILPFPVGYSLTEYHAKDSSIPDADVILINYYPFRSEDGVSGESDFKQRFNNVIKSLRDKFNGNVWIVGQSFHTGQKWTPPPVESVSWYLDISAQHNIKGLLWYELRSRDPQTGALEMPELFEVQRQAFQD